MAQVIHQIWEMKVIIVQISRSTMQVHFQHFKEPMDGVWICGAMLSVSSSTQPTFRTIRMIEAWKLHPADFLAQTECG